MNFGQAVEALKDGKKVARGDWNGKGAFIIYIKGWEMPLDQVRDGAVINKEFLISQGCNKMVIQGHIDMWTEEKEYQTGWKASQTDILANDWIIVE